MGVGATISEDGIVESYGNDEEALHAAYIGLAVMENLCLGKKCGMPYGSHMHYSVGTLTSCTQARDLSWFGLGYMKKEFVSEGTSVLVGNDITGTVTKVPFLAKQCQPVKKT